MLLRLDWFVSSPIADSGLVRSVCQITFSSKPSACLSSGSYLYRYCSINKPKTFQCWLQSKDECGNRRASIISVLFVSYIRKSNLQRKHWAHQRSRLSFHSEWKSVNTINLSINDRSTQVCRSVMRQSKLFPPRCFISPNPVMECEHNHFGVCNQTSALPDNVPDIYLVSLAVVSK